MITNINLNIHLPSTNSIFDFYILENKFLFLNTQITCKNRQNQILFTFTVQIQNCVNCRHKININ